MAKTARQIGPNEEGDPLDPQQNFAQFLFAQRDGALHATLTEELARVALAVNDTGKPGSLAVKFTFKKVGKGRQFLVSDQIKSTVPNHDIDPSFFFFDADNISLTKNDPFNPEIPGLAQLPPRSTELREVT